MSEEKHISNDKGQPGNHDDWENRVLCSDGNCIGIIDADGHCKECGKPYEGELPEHDGSSSTQTDVEFQDQFHDNENDDEKTDLEPAVEELADDADDWDNRVLCSDGNCIGVIGPNGRCKECGKPLKKDADE
jgi:hypothetical protein